MEKQPLPDYLSNGILVYFLDDHRFIYIQKRYNPDKKNWFTRITHRKSILDQDFEEDSYYVHKHKDVIKIDNGTVKRKDIEEPKKYETLIPETDIWVGLLRLPITTGNLKKYYVGKYTMLKGNHLSFINKYFTYLKNTYVTKTQGNVSNKEDVLVEKWWVFPDIASNQSVFIL